jgi:hypothetical protein
VTRVLGAVLGRVRIDLHAADRVDGGMVVSVMMFVLFHGSCLQYP